MFWLSANTLFFLSSSSFSSFTYSSSTSFVLIFGTKPKSSTALHVNSPDSFRMNDGEWNVCRMVVRTITIGSRGNVAHVPRRSVFFHAKTLLPTKTQSSSCVQDSPQRNSRMCHCERCWQVKNMSECTHILPPIPKPLWLKNIKLPLALAEYTQTPFFWEEEEGEIEKRRQRLSP